MASDEAKVNVAWGAGDLDEGEEQPVPAAPTSRINRTRGKKVEAFAGRRKPKAHTVRFPTAGYDQKLEEEARRHGTTAASFMRGLMMNHLDRAGDEGASEVAGHLQRLAREVPSLRAAVSELAAFQQEQARDLRQLARTVGELSASQRQLASVVNPLAAMLQDLLDRARVV